MSDFCELAPLKWGFSNRLLKGRLRYIKMAMFSVARMQIPN
jgi:hypothetical protein